jgi:hypothetical protein
MATRDLVSNALTAKHLSTSLEGAETVQAGERAGTAATRLGKAFDQAPVRDGDEVVGFALTAELTKSPRANVRTLMHPLQAEVVLSPDTPVRDVLPILSRHGFAFVREGDSIDSFVTPSDINRQAGRAHFYLLVAALEVALSDLLRRFAKGRDQSAFLNYLPRDGRFTVECRYLAAERDGLDVDYVTYMEFSHLLKVVGHIDELRRPLDASTRTEWEKKVGSLPDLRNDVMHSTREFLSPTRAVSDLREKQDLIIQLLDLATEYLHGATAKPASRVATGRTQQVTPVDIGAGRIRIPVDTKPIFPRVRGEISVRLRGEGMQIRYDPRDGPDRSRSGVLQIGRRALVRIVKPHEVLVVRFDGATYLLE